MTDKIVMEEIGDSSEQARFLIDMIDSIYSHEFVQEEENIEILQQTLVGWAKGKKIPPNVEAVVLRVAEEQRKRRQK